jgi:predicted small metal-binding protein
MRVIECNECGETLQAATDDELVTRLEDHLQEEHDVDDADVREIVTEGAYDAMDS